MLEPGSSSNSLSEQANTDPFFTSLGSLPAATSYPNLREMQAAHQPSGIDSLASESIPGALMQHVSSSAMSQTAVDSDGAVLRQQIQELQAQQAKHDGEIQELKQQHAAQMAALQAQAVTKMKELIEKVTVHLGDGLRLCKIGCSAYLNSMPSCRVSTSQANNMLT